MLQNLKDIELFFKSGYLPNAKSWNLIFADCFIYGYSYMHIKKKSGI